MIAKTGIRPWLDPHACPAERPPLEAMAASTRDLHHAIDEHARRTGIPISLSVVYLEVARRTGLHAEGINFPGHFLLRCEGRIVDAFHGGAILSEDAQTLAARVKHELGVVREVFKKAGMKQEAS